MVTTSIHPPQGRGTLFYFSLSFSSLGWWVGDIKRLTLHFLKSSGTQTPFEDGVLCNETFVSEGFCLSILPTLGGRSC